MKALWFALPAIIVIALFGYAWFSSGTAIVEATVLRINYVQHQYQLIVNATKAFPNFPLFAMSQCPGHHPGEIVDIGVKVSSTWAGNHPLWDEGQLYKEGGPANIGFVPWDGCGA